MKAFHRSRGRAALLGSCLVALAANAAAPVAQDQAVTTVESSRQFIYLSCVGCPGGNVENGRDAGTPATYTLVTAPLHGTLEAQSATSSPVGAGGVVSAASWYYTVAPGFTGVDTFTWNATSAEGTSNTATCTITVTTNTAPVSKGQSLSLMSTDVRRAFYLSSVDPDYSQSFTYTLTAAPAHGKLEYLNTSYLAVAPGVPVKNPGWFYTPNTGYSGADAFSWTLSDGVATSAAATVLVAITANTPPIVSDQAVSTIQDTALTVSPAFYDPDPQAFTITVATPPAHGTLAKSTTSLTDLVYTPAAGFTGVDAFTWTVNDGAAPSTTATCRILVRAPKSRGGMMVLIVVNALLLPEISAEVNQLRADLVTEGYASKVVTLPAGSSSTTLWNLLRTEYQTPGEFMTGAVLIGALPTAVNLGTLEYTDLAYWNLTKLGDVRRFDIWVSRFAGLSSSGTQQLFGTEADLLKRALEANHDYRRGLSRLPHTAYHFDIFSGTLNMDKLGAVWPETVYDHPKVGFIKGAELIHETSHGGPGAYDGYGVSRNNIHDQLAQARFAVNDSCVSGYPGGVVNNQLLTRGGGNVLSIGATATTYSTYLALNLTYGGGPAFRSLMAAGEPWGNAMLSSFPFFDRQRTMFYGDLSMPANAAPANLLPVVTLVATPVKGAAPLDVSFSASANDPDGTIASCEWFLEGHLMGTRSPSLVASTCGSTSHTFTVPHRFLARAEAVDTFKARGWAQVEVRVAPAPHQPLRINCGRYLDLWDPSSAFYTPSLDLVDASGNLWLHDQPYADGTWGTNALNGNVSAFSGHMQNPADDALFLDVVGDYFRDANAIQYAIPLVNGGYTVRFGFADLGNTAAGQRLIDGFLEGAQVLSAFDIIATGGPKVPVWVAKHVNLTDGVLNLQVKTNPASPAGTGGMAILNALEIIPDSISTCAAGGACTSTDACRSGVLSCVNNLPICSSLVSRADGTACAGGTCQGGVCTGCTAGAVCTSGDGCREGAISCATGAPVCAGLVARPDGTACSGGLCSAGVCASCAAGESCSSADTCRTGTTSCATGAPVCSGLFANPDGSPCPGGVCVGGVCGGCAQGAACTAAGGCQSGAMACGSGVPTCSALTPVADGTSCSGGVCHSGACVACRSGERCVSTDGCREGTTSCVSGAQTCEGLDSLPDGTSCSGGTCQAGWCAGGDGGAEPIDAGYGTADAGPVDGGSSGEPPPSGHGGEDAGSDPDHGSASGWVGCASASGASPLTALAFLALALRRRRPRG